jgi:hypothetical protein
MSAFVVDRTDIAYLITAALSQPGHHGPISWKGENGEWQILRSGHYDEAIKIGQMLWDENILSICYRYPDCQDKPDSMPGPIGEDFIFRECDIKLFARIKAIEVIKAVHCYEYQACEHPEWRKSEAYRFCQALKSHYIHRLPGYDEAAWGAPDHFKEAS